MLVLKNQKMILEWKEGGSLGSRRARGGPGRQMGVQCKPRDVELRSGKRVLPESLRPQIPIG